MTAMEDFLLVLQVQGAIAGGPEARPLNIYLTYRDGEWAAGWALSPGWNKGLHSVDPSGLTVDGYGVHGALYITLQPDDYIPADHLPVPVTLQISAGWQEMRLEGEYTGQRGEDAIAGFINGAITIADSVVTSDCELEIRLPDAHDWAGIDWMREGRVQIEYTNGVPGRGSFLTKYGAGETPETFIMPFDASKLTLTQATLIGDITVVYPAHPLGPDTAQPTTYNISATIAGPIIGGSFICDNQVMYRDKPATGTVRGKVRSNIAGWAPEQFAHPGMLNSLEDFALIAGRVEAGAQPWSMGLEKVKADVAAVWDITPRPMAEYIFTHASMPGHSRDILTDGLAVYGSALIWAITGEEKYAEKALEILNAYSSTLKTISVSRTDANGFPDDQSGNILGISYALPQFIWAAEIMRYTCREWAEAEQARFTKLLTDVVYPVASIYGVDNNIRSWNLCTRMAVAIFTDDPGKFNIVVDAIADHVPDYTAPTGRCRETMRDLWHTQMSFAPLLACAEMAWQQGLDLYSLYNNRLLAGVEYHVPFIYGELENWPGGDRTPAREVGKFWNMYELAYYHYHTRCGLDCPNTRRVVQDRRPEGWDRVGWGTLTHAGEE
ncbi:MAG: alginate lyase family protein [bacterium]